MNNDDANLWEQYVAAFKRSQETALQFRSLCSNPVVYIKAGLYTPDERQATLHFFEILTVEELKQVLPNLVSLAVTEMGHNEFARVQILRIPKSWLLDNIESIGSRVIEKVRLCSLRRIVRTLQFYRPQPRFENCPK